MLEAGLGGLRARARARLVPFLGARQHFVRMTKELLSLMLFSPVHSHRCHSSGILIPSHPLPWHRGQSTSYPLQTESVLSIMYFSL